MGQGEGHCDSECHLLMQLSVMKLSLGRNAALK